MIVRRTERRWVSLARMATFRSVLSFCISGGGASSEYLTRCRKRHLGAVVGAGRWGRERRHDRDAADRMRALDIISVEDELRKCRESVQDVVAFCVKVDRLFNGRLRRVGVVALDGGLFFCR